jgi:hypothetical protein
LTVKWRSPKCLSLLLNTTHLSSIWRESDDAVAGQIKILASPKLNENFSFSYRTILNIPEQIVSTLLVLYFQNTKIKLDIWTWFYFSWMRFGTTLYTMWFDYKPLHYKPVATYFLYHGDQLFHDIFWFLCPSFRMWQSDDEI